MPERGDVRNVGSAFREEIDQERRADEIIGKEIDDFYNRNVHTHLDLPGALHPHVFAQDGAGVKWSRKCSNLMMKYMCGNSDMCSFTMSEEAASFRRMTGEAFRYEWLLFSEAYPHVNLSHAMRVLPPRVILPSLERPCSERDAPRVGSESYSGNTMDVHICEKVGTLLLPLRVWYTDGSGCECSHVFSVNGDTSANSVIALVSSELSYVARLNDALHRLPHQDSIAVIRVKSHKEYIFGAERIADFRYMRACLNAHVEANVVMQYFPRQHFADPLFRPSYPSMMLPNWTHDEIESGKSNAGDVRSVWSCSGRLNVYVDDIHQRLNELNQRCANATELYRDHPRRSTSCPSHNQTVRTEDDRRGVSCLCEVSESKDVPAERNSELDHVHHVALLVDVCFGREACCRPQLSEWIPRSPDVSPSSLPSGREAASTMELSQTSPAVEEASVEGSTHTGGSMLFDVALSDLPREVRLCFTLVGARDSKSSGVPHWTVTDILNSVDEESQRCDDADGHFVFLSAGVVYLYRVDGVMCTGNTPVMMFRNNCRATIFGFSANCDSAGCEPVALTVRLPDFGPSRMVYPSGRPPAVKQAQAARALDKRELKLHSDLRDSEVEQLRQLKRIFCRDLLAELSEDDKVLVWRYRHTLLQFPNALPKFLSSVDWLQPYDVYEAHCLIRQWEPLSGFDALCLLDARYADTVARDQAIMFVNTLSDYELRNCILQLVQVLRYEAYHYSSLARFLLKRFFNCDHLIGHYIFWHMAAELYNTSARERYVMMLEEIITRSPLRRQYLRQVYVTNQLLRCVLAVQQASKKDRINTLQASLALVRLPHRFVLPLSSSMECCALDISSCRVMDSKKFPLWLAFRSYFEPEHRFYVIFKSGDDLRQDCLTLQLLEIMDTIWKSNHLDLHITTYGCVSTGKDVGMIEAVLDSETIANITRSDGGAQAAFSDEPLLKWLRQFNHTRDDIERCIKNFVHSVAGYIVASYILGIGDRHNDNIMLCTNGTLFHIDFSHFLGNYKSKFGFKRETAPFIFTPMYCHVMGGVQTPIYKYFVELASYAYNVLRRYGNILIMLFLLMLPTGIAELKTKEDIYWLRGVLLSGSSSESAVEHFKSLITEALNNKRTLINDYIHIMAH